MSLVARLFALIALTLLLVAGGEVINGLALRQDRLAEVREETTQLALIAELDMGRILEGSRQLLATLAKLPVRGSWDARSCAVLEVTASSDFEYDHIVAVDRSGTIVCSSSGPAVVGSKAADIDLVNRILTTARFSVSTFGVATVSGNEVVRVGYPVVDDSGTTVGAVFAGINVTWLNTAINQWKVGKNVSIQIADRDGILIADFPEPRNVGRPIADALNPFLSAARPGATEVKDAGGTVRLYGYAPLDNDDVWDGFAVFIGRDQTPIFAGINRSILLNAAVVLLALLASAIVGVAYARRFLAPPFGKLLAAAGRWRAGDWSARAGGASGIPEFDRLAQAFDGMAAEVAARDATLRSLARHDVLTGLANRGVFVEALQAAIAQARRGADVFAVLYMDLDHFKDVNDTLGHPVGDLLLQAVATRLQAIVRATDTVARFGGDEFALIATGLKEPADAAILADKVLAAVSAPLSLQGKELRSGASVGIAVYGPDSPDAEALLSHADVALYRAKSEGRGTYRFFTDAMDADVRARVTLEAELRAAIGAGELFLVFQPQVDAESSRIMGVEALVRWRHPLRGVISPAEFIPVAEKSGLIVALGHWIMREACRQMKAWLDAGIAPPLIAVNLSSLQFKTPLELERDFAAILAETGVPARRVELELTESVLMNASRERGDVLLRLRKAGFRISIDDFGTGYSSLMYLRRFPVDRIKIAQEFMADIVAGSSNAAIVQAAISLASALKLDVVVEGVETAEQLELVKSMGAREIQGYYYSKPLPAGPMAALLRTGTIVPPHSAAMVGSSYRRSRLRL
jgi:diguanylate cyclase (GGDEF)-like protein